MENDQLNEKTESKNFTEKKFIESLIISKKEVSIFLKNGIRLVGVIVAADDQTLALVSENFSQQLVYKDNINTIFPEVKN